MRKSVSSFLAEARLCMFLRGGAQLRVSVRAIGHSGERFPPTVVSVFGRGVPDLTAVPEALTLVISEFDLPATTAFTVVSRRGRPFVIQDVTWGQGIASVVVQSLGNQEQHRMKAVFCPSTTSGGSSKIVVVVKADDGRVRNIDIPVLYRLLTAGELYRLPSPMKRLP